MDRKTPGLLALTPSRRAVLAGAASLLPTPLLAAPSATDVEAWAAYRERLTARLADGGRGVFDDDSGRAALRLANAARAAARARPLVWHDGLAETARAHAADLADRRYVEHLSPEGFDPSHRFWLIERRTVGSPTENIAYHRGPSPASPDQLVGQWRRSPPHWENLLRRSHTHAAFAVVRRPDRAWLVGLFLKPLASLAAPLRFRIRDFDQAREAIKGWTDLPADLRPRVGAPQGAAAGPEPAAPPWVMQLALRRPVAGNSYELIGGPIFLMGASS